MHLLKEGCVSSEGNCHGWSVRWLISHGGHRPVTASLQKRTVYGGQWRFYQSQELIMETVQKFGRTSFIALVRLFACGKKRWTRSSTQKLLEKYTCRCIHKLFRTTRLLPDLRQDLVKNGCIYWRWWFHHAKRIARSNWQTYNQLTRFENMGENTILTGKTMVNEEQTGSITAGAGPDWKIILRKLVSASFKVRHSMKFISSHCNSSAENIFWPFAIRRLKEQRYESFLKASEKKLIPLAWPKSGNSTRQQNKTDSGSHFFLPCRHHRADRCNRRTIRFGRQPLYRNRKAWSDLDGSGTFPGIFPSKIGAVSSCSSQWVKMKPVNESYFLKPDIDKAVRSQRSRSDCQF